MPVETTPPKLEEMWREFAAPLRSFLLGRVRNAADVDDLLQEIFLRVHQRIQGLRDAARLEGWLYQIARNVVIDHYRNKRPSETLTDHLGAAPDELSLDDGIDLRPAVRRMINELPAKYRDAIVLTEFCGQSQKEGAQELGVSLTAMKSRVQRGRMLLRAMLDNCCRFEFDRRGKVIDAVPRDGGCEC